MRRRDPRAGCLQGLAAGCAAGDALARAPVQAADRAHRAPEPIGRDRGGQQGCPARPGWDGRARDPHCRGPGSAEGPALLYLARRGEEAV